MHKLWTAALSAVALFAVEPACAQSGIEYDCDTAAEHFSELILPSGDGNFSVTGTVRTRAIADIKKYAPLTTVTVSQTGDRNSAQSGFTVQALPAKAVKLPALASGGMVQTLAWNDGNHNTDQIVEAIAYGQAVPFQLTFDGKAVTMQVGAHRRSVPFTASKPMIRVVCSGGEFLYSNLRVERAQ